MLLPHDSVRNLIDAESNKRPLRSEIPKPPSDPNQTSNRRALEALNATDIAKLASRREFSKGFDPETSIDRVLLCRNPSSEGVAGLSRCLALEIKTVVRTVVGVYTCFHKKAAIASAVTVAAVRAVDGGGRWWWWWWWWWWCCCCCCCCWCWSMTNTIAVAMAVAA